MKQENDSLKKQAEALQQIQALLEFETRLAFARAMDVDPARITRWMHLDSPERMSAFSRKKLAETIGKQCQDADQFETIRQKLAHIGWTLTEDEWRVAESNLRQHFVPWQMPQIDPERFVGREAELSRVVDELRKPRAQTPVVIEGMPGVGKTTLVARLWAERAVRVRFADGILWVRMESGAPGSPLSPHELYERAFVSLREQVFLGTGPQAQNASFFDVQRALASRRMLLVVDGLDASIELSRWVSLTAAGQGRLLITTRMRQLLDEAWVLRLEPLNPEFALKMLTRDVDVEVDPDVLNRIVDAVEGLPLALYLINRNARLDRTFIQLLAQPETQEIVSLLSREEDVQRNLALSFALSYERLDESSAGLFRFLGIFPQPFACEAVAYVLGWETGAVIGAFHDLVKRGLVKVSGPGIYHMHRLLQEYAYDLAGTQDRVHLDVWHNRFADYYCNRTETAWQHWEKDEPRQALDIWREEITHINQGFHYAAALKQRDRILRYMLSTSFYLGYSGLSETVREWRARFEEVVQDDAGKTVGKLHLGQTYLLLDNPVEAIEILEDAWSLAQSLDPQLRLNVTVEFVRALLATGQVDRAWCVLGLDDDEDFARVVDSLDEMGPLFIQIQVVCGDLCQTMDDLEQARQNYLSALQKLGCRAGTQSTWLRMAIMARLADTLWTETRT